MLGISSYFADLDYKYLEEAAKIGAKYLFISLHIPEEDLSDIDQSLPEFLKRTKNLGFEVVPDISPLTLEKLGLENNDYTGLMDLGFTTLRLDFGFEDYTEVKKLQKDFQIIINSSTLNRSDLVMAKDAGVDLDRVIAIHNFYPKTNTGLSSSYFKKMNKLYLELGIRTMAFVPGDLLKRFPLYEGLPTLEKHRQMNPYVAAVEFIEMYGTTDILIGDSKANINTLKWIKEYMNHKIMNLPVHLTKENLIYFDKDHFVRKDLSESVIRLTEERVPNVEIRENNVRNRGSITMENKLAGRYSGEMQICKKDFPMSSASNVLGFVHPDYIELLEFINNDTTIRFVPLI